MRERISFHKENTMTDKLRDAVYTVLEGFTLPHDVRKILETAYYGSSPESSLAIMHQFPNGMTVRELKEVVKSWPETDEFGDDREVWMEVDDEGSNQVKSIMPLNAQYGDNLTITSADILFEAKTK
jgi:hypothetical protein